MASAMVPGPGLPIRKSAARISRCTSFVKPTMCTGFFHGGDHVLLLDRLDPESRRKIRQVRDDSDKRTAGINPVPAFPNLPIEMGNYGNEQFRRFFTPESFEQIH